METLAKLAPLRRAPGRNLALMRRAERSLTRKLHGFLRVRARELAAQIVRQIDSKKSAEVVPDGRLIRPADRRGTPLGRDLGALPHSLLAAAALKATHDEDMAEARAAAILAALGLGDWDVLIDPTAEELAAVFADGYTAGAELLSIGVSTDQVNPLAVEWAHDRAAELVTQIEDNTRDMLRATVTEAVSEGWGAVELGARLEESAGFGEYRSERIARTEVIRANNQGNLKAYKDSGVATGKAWETAHDDLVEEECEANEAQGPIGLDDDFDSGDDAPPAHPNCRCAIVPWTEPLDGGESEDVEAVAKALNPGSGRIDPANARPVDLPIADEETRDQVMHEAWQRVQSPNFALVSKKVSITDIVATQEEIDAERADEHEAHFREVGSYPRPPVVFGLGELWYILDGHHRVEGAKHAGAEEIDVAAVEGSEQGEGPDLTALAEALAPLGHRITKAEADYVAHPEDGERCGSCTMFLPPDACSLVRGSIADHGHCRFWKDRE